MKRKKTGRFIEWQNIKERSISKDEKTNGSPYWSWMEKYGQQSDDGDIIETPRGNPDVLEGNSGVYEEPSDPEHGEGLLHDTIKSVLTQKQAEIMLLIIEGYTQAEITRILKVNQGYVSKTIVQAKKKLKKYL